MPDHPVLLDAIAAERAYGAGAITQADHIEALNEAWAVSERASRAGQNGPMSAACAVGSHTLRDVAHEVARAQGWLVGGCLKSGAARNAAIQAASDAEFLAQIDVIARSFGGIK